MRVLRRFTRRRRLQSRSPAQARSKFVEGNFMDGLEHLKRRRIPTLVVFGDEDGNLDDWHEASENDERFAELISGEPWFETVVLSGCVHRMHAVDVQRAVRDVVVEWTTRLASSTSTSPVAVPVR
jgi:hypothetical protein